MLFWSSAAQVACYSPNSTAVSHFVLVPLVPPSHGSGPSWSLPPGPGSGCNASCTCRANLPCARSCSSRNSILARFLALNQTFVSLSLPPSLSVCLLSLCVQSLPPFRPAVVHTRTCTTSTRFPPIGTCSDLTATPKQNSGQTHLSPTTSSKPLGARIDAREPLACPHTPARPAPSFSLCLGSAHLVFPWPSTESISFRL